MNLKALKLAARIALVMAMLALTLPLTAAHADDSTLVTGVTATTKYNLRLRSGPGTGFQQIGLVPGGTTLTVEGRNSASSWVQVTYRGTQGWMSAAYCIISGNLSSVPVTDGGGAVTPGDLQPTGITATPTVNLRIRRGPGTGYTQIGLIRAHTTAQVLGKNAASNWLYVDYEGTKGWVAEWYANPSGSLAGVPYADGTSSTSGTTTPTGGVTATTTVNLRIRQGPNTTYTQIGLAPRGTVLAVEGRNAASNWLQIDYNGTKGWVAAWYTTISGSLDGVAVTDGSGTVEQPTPEPTPEPTQQPSGPVTATTTVDLRIRQGPSTTYTRLVVVPRGTTLEVKGRNEASDGLFIE